MSGEYIMTQEKEMELALNEGRQPNCVFCNKPLDRIVQTQYDRISWDWNRKLRLYIKVSSCGDSDKPCHPACGAGDWDFVDYKMVSY